MNLYFKSTVFIMEIPKIMSSKSDKQVRKRTKEEYLRIFMEFDADNSGSVSKS